MIHEHSDPNTQKMLKIFQQYQTLSLNNLSITDIRSILLIENKGYQHSLAELNAYGTETPLEVLINCCQFYESDMLGILCKLKEYNVIGLNLQGSWTLTEGHFHIIGDIMKQKKLLSLKFTPTCKKEEVLKTIFDNLSQSSIIHLWLRVYLNDKQIDKLLGVSQKSVVKYLTIGVTNSKLKNFETLCNIDGPRYFNLITILHAKSVGKFKIPVELIKLLFQTYYT
jgi:hypothetical protein